jgi:hypothetical protein
MSTTFASKALDTEQYNRYTNLMIGMAYGWIFEKSLGCGIISFILDDQFMTDDESFLRGSYAKEWATWRDFVYKG